MNREFEGDQVAAARETAQSLRGTASTLGFSQIQLPIIMATSKDEDEDIVRCFDAGANDFVAKPINFPVLFARIETQLKLKRATEELERLAGGG